MRTTGAHKFLRSHAQSLAVSLARPHTTFVACRRMVYIIKIIIICLLFVYKQWHELVYKHARVLAFHSRLVEPEL